MNERLLQFIWQFQYFNKDNLRTIDDLPLQILKPGTLNTNQGPDFLDAQIKLNNTLWAGNIEIHILGSDWNLHGHSNDPNYSNVILHVVWENNSAVVLSGGQTIPTIEMQPLIAKTMLETYYRLMQQDQFVSCTKHLPALSDIAWVSWKERLAVERLLRKSSGVIDLVKKSNNHWEETFWWLLARNFGIKLNSEVFEEIAVSIPLNVLAKHKSQIHQLEALLFGQAGLLNDEREDDYYRLLQREYKLLSTKFNLRSVGRKPDLLRMRPANFPTVRLAQLAMLIHHSNHMFSRVLEANHCRQLYSLLNVTTNDYWHYHYRFGETTAYHPKTLGKTMAENILINTIIPVLYAYGQHKKIEAIQERAVAFLSQISAEKNTITRNWEKYGIANLTALDSQALIELKNSYCNKHLCLECAVGNKILRSDKTA